MFLSFVDELRRAGIPASVTEHLLLLEALDRDVIAPSPDEFYYLARATFVHDEGMIDRFDAVFGQVFRGLEPAGDGKPEIPEEWLRKVAELYLTPEQMAEIKSLGSWDEIMDTLRKRLEEQKERHAPAHTNHTTSDDRRFACRLCTMETRAKERRRDSR